MFPEFFHRTTAKTAAGCQGLGSGMAKGYNASGTWHGMYVCMPGQGMERDGTEYGTDNPADPGSEWVTRG